MEWKTYCITHIKLMSKVISDVKLALRNNKEQINYRTCSQLYDDLLCAESLVKDDQLELTKEDMLFFYSRIFIWCVFYCKDIHDDATRHSAWLLGNQLRKRTKNMIQRIKSTSKVSEDIDLENEQLLNFLMDAWD